MVIVDCHLYRMSVASFAFPVLYEWDIVNLHIPSINQSWHLLPMTWCLFVFQGLKDWTLPFQVHSPRTVQTDAIFIHSKKESPPKYFGHTMYMAKRIGFLSTNLKSSLTPPLEWLLTKLILRVENSGTSSQRRNTCNKKCTHQPPERAMLPNQGRARPQAPSSGID